MSKELEYKTNIMTAVSLPDALEESGVQDDFEIWLPVRFATFGEVSCHIVVPAWIVLASQTDNVGPAYSDSASAGHDNVRL